MTQVLMLVLIVTFTLHMALHMDTPRKIDGLGHSSRTNGRRAHATT
jgi:hypothetical protein